MQGRCRGGAGAVQVVRERCRGGAGGAGTVQATCTICTSASIISDAGRCRRCRHTSGVSRGLEKIPHTARAINKLVIKITRFPKVVVHLNLFDKIKQENRMDGMNSCMNYLNILFIIVLQGTLARVLVPRASMGVEQRAGNTAVFQYSRM